MIKLGVNIDHVATLRQARGTAYPSPIDAAVCAQKAGAHNITCHLREDRRHIQDADVLDLMAAIDIPLNFEMAARDEMFDLALKLKPHTVTLVPEKREELTTEEGLNVTGLSEEHKQRMQELQAEGVNVSLFIDANLKSIDAAMVLGVQELEFHTGFFADAQNAKAQALEKEKLVTAIDYAEEHSFVCHLGHGLNLSNIPQWQSQSKKIESAQIGHALIAHAVFVGMEQATKDYLSVLS